jgi:hypothetical protein
MMHEPERMIAQTTSALERALLQEGRAYRRSDALRTHTLAGLGLAGSTGLAVSVLAWLSAKSWTTKLILALSTAGLLSAVPVSYMLRVGNTHPAQATSPASVRMPSPTRAAPTGLVAPIAVPEPAPARAMDSSAVVPPAPAQASATTSSALRAELAALDAVRSTLANDDPAGALSFLAAYFRTFPRGRLRYEADVLRIAALAQAGQRDTARRYALKFLKRHPNSVLTARVRPYAEQ